MSGLFAEGDNPEKFWECGPIFELKLNHGMGLNPALSDRGGHGLHPNLLLY